MNQYIRLAEFLLEHGACTQSLDYVYKMERERASLARIIERAPLPAWWLFLLRVLGMRTHYARGLRAMVPLKATPLYVRSSRAHLLAWAAGKCDSASTYGEAGVVAAVRIGRKVKRAAFRRAVPTSVIVKHLKKRLAYL